MLGGETVKTKNGIFLYVFHISLRKKVLTFPQNLL